VQLSPASAKRRGQSGHDAPEPTAAGDRRGVFVDAWARPVDSLLLIHSLSGRAPVSAFLQQPTSDIRAAFARGNI